MCSKICLRDTYFHTSISNLTTSCMPLCYAMHGPCRRYQEKVGKREMELQEQLEQLDDGEEGPGDAEISEVRGAGGEEGPR